MRAIASQANQQKVGLPSKLLGVLDAPVDARSGKVSISITPALERQVFAEYPAVAAMFAATVPHARSRKQFFEEFIKALRNRISRRRKKAAGAARLPAVKENQLLTRRQCRRCCYRCFCSGCLGVSQLHCQRCRRAAADRVTIVPAAAIITAA